MLRVSLDLLDILRAPASADFINTLLEIPEDHGCDSRRVRQGFRLGTNLQLV
jgi:hypothetical protein